MADDWMREGTWESDSEMTAEQEAIDRRFLDAVVRDMPGPAHQWRMENTISVGDRTWRWRSAHPISDPDLPPIPPP